jgi:hypothetical protein
MNIQDSSYGHAPPTRTSVRTDRETRPTTPTEQTQPAPVTNGGQATESPPARRPHSKTLHHQVQEVYRLVEDATENLEQVLRAIRFIEKDL